MVLCAYSKGIITDLNANKTKCPYSMVVIIKPKERLLSA